jgi:hypothetical protein
VTNPDVKIKKKQSIHRVRGDLKSEVKRRMNTNSDEGAFLYFVF